jgi:hypothetical protein
MKSAWKISFVTYFVFAFQASAQAPTNPNFSAQFSAWQAGQQAQMSANLENQAAAAAKAQRSQVFGNAIIGVCNALLGSKTSKGVEESRDVARKLDQQAFEEREALGYQYDGQWNQDAAREIGTAAHANFASGCDQFMNAEGKLGPWGDYALQQIRSKPESFGNNVPDDITTWCPRYPSMSREEREMSWVWNLASMASSESSCNPAAVGPKYNGIPLGLFQVWKEMEPNSCQYADSLLNPRENIRCAVDQLGMELADRGSLMTPERITYWGVLRTDDWNAKRGGDIEAAQKTRALMKKNPYCTQEPAARQHDEGRR